MGSWVSKTEEFWKRDIWTNERGEGCSWGVQMMTGKGIFERSAGWYCDVSWGGGEASARAQHLVVFEKGELCTVA